MNNNLSILSCVWNRPERLEYTLKQLSKQTNNNFHLYLICNNIDLYDFVEKEIHKNWGYTIVPIYHSKNFGPFARIKAMYMLGTQYDYYLTLDDDAIFDNTFVEQWNNYLEPNTIKGWNGFNFVPNKSYWDRTEVNYGEKCHYLWGSNLCIPNNLVDFYTVVLKEKYWNCDDLWLCYCANVIKQMDVMKVKIENFKINIDGKDTYLSQHNVKIEFLDYLRNNGWEV